MRARGKNVRRRPVPGGRVGSRGVKRRAVRTEEDRDLVSRGAEQEAKDEQEDLRIYEPEMGGVLGRSGHWDAAWRSRLGRLWAAEGTTAVTDLGTAVTDQHHCGDGSTPLR